MSTRILRQPVTAAVGLSLLLHAALLLSFGPLSAPRPADDSLEVTLSAAARVPSVRTPPPIANRSAAHAHAQPAPVDARATDAAASARYDIAALNNPKPPYPLAARRAGAEGRVLLSAHVRADGSCGDVRLKQSSGHRLLDESALTTIKRWRFRPAQRGTTPVDSWVDVPIHFQLKG